MLSWAVRLASFLERLKSLEVVDPEPAALTPQALGFVPTRSCRHFDTLNLVLLISFIRSFTMMLQEGFYARLQLLRIPSVPGGDWSGH